MRFAYINSQGKEVSIPSVEALQLRIELGAITSSTMFYDSGEDRWAPAAEHDIFRTLQRELAERDEGGFVAPPPPTLERTEPPALQAEGDSEVTAEAPFEEESVEPDVFPETDGPGPAEIEPQSEPQSESQSESEPQSEPSEKSEPEPAVSEPLGGFDLGLTALSLDSEPRPRPSETRAPDAADEPDSWALEDPPEGGPLELEAPLADQAFGGLEAIVDDGGGAYGSETPPGWASEEPPGAPLSIEPDPSESMSFTAEPFDDGDWREPATDPRTSSGLAMGPGTAARSEHAPRVGTTPVPDSPRRRGSRARALTLFSVLVVVVGGGGWFAWSLFANGALGGGIQPPADVEVPTLPTALESAYRGLVDGAMADLVAQMQGQVNQARLPTAPPSGWLSGRYLAGASTFTDVPAYWNAMSGLVDRLRQDEGALFEAAFQARMTSAGIEAEDQGQLESRAMAGFQAAFPDRAAAWDGLAEVYAAALDLHDFLELNEDHIDYQPAAAGGISGDPVLEAVPLTPQLNDDMWERLERLSASLEALGALSTDGVSTGRLISTMLGRLGDTPVR